MLKLENTVNTVVETILPRNSSDKEFNGLVVTINMSFMEHFSANYDKPISEKTLVELEDKYPFLSISENMVEVNTNFSLLFLRRNGYYQCFSNIGNMFPLMDLKDTVWVYETNHDSCWRDNAYTSINKHIAKIKTAIYDIFKDYDEANISIPKHVVPNYASIERIEKCSIENSITGDYGQYITLNVSNVQKPSIRKLLEIKTVSKKEYLETMFDKVYDLAISNYHDLVLGTPIYGTFIEQAIVSSEVFRDKNDVVWVQIQDVNDVNRKYMLSLSTYGINYTGTHNLVFTDKDSYIMYRNTELIVENRSDPVDGWCPDWVTPKQGKRTPISKEVFDKLPIKEWSVTTNDFI